MGDVISFISKGRVETASGQGAFESPRHAFLVALRLFAAPQYEGGRTEEVDAALEAIKQTWEDPPQEKWNAFRAALEEVSL